MTKKKNNIVHIKLYKAAVKYKAELSGGRQKTVGTSGISEPTQ